MLPLLRKPEFLGFLFGLCLFGSQQMPAYLLLPTVCVAYVLIVLFRASLDFVVAMIWRKDCDCIQRCRHARRGVCGCVLLSDDEDDFPV